MSDHPKYLCFTFRVWWFIFLFLNCFLIALMIGSLGAGKWVYTDVKFGLVNPKWEDTDNNVFNGKEFEGNLFRCTESCDESWGKLAQEWCDYSTDVKDEADSNYIYAALEDPVQSVCALYFVLFAGSAIYGAFEILALICLTCWIIGMFMYWAKVKCCLVFSMVCSGCVWFGHYVAFIAFMTFTRTNYMGICDEWEDDGVNPQLCASDGPGLALFIAIIIPIIVVAYCIVGCRLKHKHGPDGLRHKVGEQQHNGQFHGQPNGNFNPPYNNPVVVYPPYPAPTQGQPLENIDQTSMNPPGVYPPLYPPKY